MYKNIIFNLLLFISIFCSLFAAKNEFKIVGYYPSWGLYRSPSFQPQHIDPKLVTHINYAFAKVDVQGNIHLVDSWADVEYRSDWNMRQPFWGNFRALSDLKKQAPHLKTLISIGGWTLSDTFSELAACAEARANFAKNALAFCKDYDFDGVDIDWEYPGFAEHSGRPEDRENYTLLLEELALKLQPEQRLLTIAAPAGSFHYKNMEIAKIHHYVDWINLMTYDLHGPWNDADNQLSNHQAALFSPKEADPTLCISACVDYYLSQGVPAKKLVLGLPLYGRVFKETAGLYQPHKGPGTGTTQEAGVRFFYDIKQNLLPKLARGFDAEATASYLYDPDTREFISFDDEEVLRLKSRYIREMGLGGAMVWELGQDVPKSFDAMHAIKKELSK